MQSETLQKIADRLDFEAAHLLHGGEEGVHVNIVLGALGHVAAFGSKFIRRNLSESQTETTRPPVYPWEDV